MAITREQCRMARALLDWSTKELSAKTGISLQGLSLLENGRTHPHKSTLEVLEQVFNLAGVDFLPNNGVRNRDENIQKIEGADAYCRLLALVTATTQHDPAAQVLFFFVDNARSNKATVAAHQQLRAVAQCRYLCRDAPARLDFPASDYRAVPAQFFHNAPQVIFGEYVAQVVVNDPPSIMVIRSRELAIAARCSFEYFWSTLPTPQVK